MIQPHRTPIVTYVKDELDALQRAVSDHGEDSLIQYTILSMMMLWCLVMTKQNALEWKEIEGSATASMQAPSLLQEMTLSVASVA